MKAAEARWLLMDQMFEPQTSNSCLVLNTAGSGEGVSQCRSTGESDSTASAALLWSTSASSVFQGVLFWIVFVFVCGFFPPP